MKGNEMNATQAKELLDKVVGAVFGYQNPLSLDQAMQKFAFDIKLPQQVYDAVTGQPTWATSVNPSQFITVDNARTYGEAHNDWMIEKQPVQTVEDIIMIWAKTNMTSTERYIDSVNVAESDSINHSENVYRSAMIRRCKNVLFSRGCVDSEYIVASSEASTSSFSIRAEDSQLVSNSFNVIWSAKVTNSFFIQDCYDVMDCMFCSHLAGKQYCIANMQFEREEYERLKLLVIQWIFNS